MQLSGVCYRWTQYTAAQGTLLLPTCSPQAGLTTDPLPGEGSRAAGLVPAATGRVTFDDGNEFKVGAVVAADEFEHIGLPAHSPKGPAPSEQNC